MLRLLFCFPVPHLSVPLQHAWQWDTLPVPLGKRLKGVRVALGKSLSRGEYSSVKGKFTPVALETALEDLLFFLLAKTLNNRV